MKIAGTCKPAGRRGRIKGGKYKSKRTTKKQPKGTGARQVAKKGASASRQRTNNKIKPRSK